MAAGPEISVESATKTASTDSPAAVHQPEVAVNTEENDRINVVNSDDIVESDTKSEMKMQDIVDMLSTLKLNPLAKEFFPSSYSPIDRPRDQPHPAFNYSVPVYYRNSPGNGIEGYPNYRRRRNNYSQGRRRLNGRSSRAQREDSIRRTVYVSDIDHNVTEERLAALFSAYGQIQQERLLAFVG